MNLNGGDHIYLEWIKDMNEYVEYVDITCFYI